MIPAFNVLTPKRIRREFSLESFAVENSCLLFFKRVKSTLMERKLFRRLLSLAVNLGLASVGEWLEKLQFIAFRQIV